MTVLRVVQVSDTHLSRERAYFHDNWRVFVETMLADPPDLIVHSGDISLNGMEVIDDLRFARRELARLPGRVVIIPGNHDIGDNPPDRGPGHEITDARRRNWLDQFGQDWWHADLPGYRLIGLNSQLLDSGLAAEAEQQAWLEVILAQSENRQILLFVHKPLCYHDMADPKIVNYCLHPRVRHPLAELVARHGIKIVASGHLHAYREMLDPRFAMVWAPSTAFINTSERNRPAIEKIVRPGYLEFQLSPDGIAHRLIEPPLFIGHDTRNWSMAAGSTTHLPPRPLAREWDTATAEAR